MRKPFDLLAKGLVTKDSRGDKTRLELFYRGVVELQTSQPLLWKQIAAITA